MANVGTAERDRQFRSLKQGALIAYRGIWHEFVRYESWSTLYAILQPVTVDEMCHFVAGGKEYAIEVWKLVERDAEVQHG